MKKDLLTHFAFMVALFVLISLYKDWLRLEFLPFWFGGIIGTFLPDVDHLIYVYVLKPNEAVSQKVTELLSQRKFFQSWNMLATMRSERKDLLFHSAHFQILFILFALLITTSSGSLLGRGLVLSFMLHLLIDEVVDLMEVGNLDSWFSKLPIVLTELQRRLFLAGNGALLLVFGFFF